METVLKKMLRPYIAPQPSVFCDRFCRVFANEHGAQIVSGGSMPNHGYHDKACRSYRHC